jgi:hypothetical protein
MVVAVKVSSRGRKSFRTRAVSPEEINEAPFVSRKSKSGGVDAVRSSVNGRKVVAVCV